VGLGLFLFCSLADVLRRRPSGAGAAPDSHPLGGVNQHAGLSHECLSFGPGDETWGVVHVMRRLCDRVEAAIISKVPAARNCVTQVQPSHRLHDELVL